jgi:hypothetical protein
MDRGAQTIVTLNLKDFPPRTLDGFEIIGEASVFALDDCSFLLAPRILSIASATCNTSRAYALLCHAQTIQSALLRRKVQNPTLRLSFD